jgi:hypothetical protein
MVMVMISNKDRLGNDVSGWRSTVSSVVGLRSIALRSIALRSIALGGISLSGWWISLYWRVILWWVSLRSISTIILRKRIVRLVLLHCCGRMDMCFVSLWFGFVKRIKREAVQRFYNLSYDTYHSKRIPTPKVKTQIFSGQTAFFKRLLRLTFGLFQGMFGGKGRGRRRREGSKDKSISRLLIYWLLLLFLI